MGEFVQSESFADRKRFFKMGTAGSTFAMKHGINVIDLLAAEVSASCCGVNLAVGIVSFFGA